MGGRSLLPAGFADAGQSALDPEEQIPENQRGYHGQAKTRPEADYPPQGEQTARLESEADVLPQSG